MMKNELLDEALPKRGEVHKKNWGYELWIENNDKYCGKLLVFNKGAKFSMHYHLKKEETWYISKGEFQLFLIDTENANHLQPIRLVEGQIIHLLPGQPHQMLALTEGATIFEISTTHYEEDSYRVLPGDSQR